MKKVLSIILAGIAVGCLIVAGVLVLREWKQHRNAQEIWEELRPSGDPSTKESSSTTEATSTDETQESQSGESTDASQESQSDASTDASQESQSDSGTDASQEAQSDTGTEASQETQSDTGTETSQEAQSDNGTDTSQESQSDNGTDASQPDTSTDASQPADNLVANPYADSFLANEDMAAWLTVPGTEIDYPVMWTPRDENYYLYKDFEGKENKNGCLILDTDSCLDPLTTNLIIHGHNMKSGAMFGNLTDYTSKDYYENHKQIILHTETGQRNYEVIAAFRSQVYKKTDQVFKFYKFFQADTEEEFNDFYDNIKKLSLYDTGVTARFGDHFITLSTCVYHVTNGRFVVVAKEVDSTNSYLPLE